MDGEWGQQRHLLLLPSFWLLAFWHTFSAKSRSAKPETVTSPLLPAPLSFEMDPHGSPKQPTKIKSKMHACSHVVTANESPWIESGPVVGWRPAATLAQPQKGVQQEVRDWRASFRALVRMALSFGIGGEVFQ